MRSQRPPEEPPEDYDPTLAYGQCTVNLYRKRELELFEERKAARAVKLPPSGSHVADLSVRAGGRYVLLTAITERAWNWMQNNLDPEVQVNGEERGIYIERRHLGPLLFFADKFALNVVPV